MYIGDIRLGQTFDTKFCTVQSTGAPTTLAGSPVISCYVGNGTTEITAGITLTVDFDGRTGLNNVRVVATSGNTYATATDNQLVITTGTVNSVSAVGYVVGQFSIENRSALMPTTSGRTLDVASTGEAGLDFANINVPLGAIAALGIVDNGTAQGATPTTLQLRSAAAFADDELIGATILITGGTGVGQARVITDYVGATDTATVDTWTTTPSGTITYVVFGSAPGSTSVPAPANVVQADGVALGTHASGMLPADVRDFGGAAGTFASGRPEVLLGAAGSVALTESYAADGAAATIPQLLYLILALLGEKSISGVTLTAKKLDGSTQAATFTLNDATNPTSITRAS